MGGIDAVYAYNHFRNSDMTEEAQDRTEANVEVNEAPEQGIGITRNELQEALGEALEGMRGGPTQATRPNAEYRVDTIDVPYDLTPPRHVDADPETRNMNFLIARGTGGAYTPLAETRWEDDGVVNEGRDLEVACRAATILGTLQAQNRVDRDARNNLLAQGLRTAPTDPGLTTGTRGVVRNAHVHDPQENTPETITMVRDTPGADWEEMKESTLSGYRGREQLVEACMDHKVPFTRDKGLNKVLYAARCMAFMEQHAVMCLAKDQEPNLDVALNTYNQIHDLMEAHMKDGELEF